MAKYLKHTDICIGARVATLTGYFLPEVGLYNRVVGNVVEIVYQDRPVGPNDKQHYHLPDYVVVLGRMANLKETIKGKRSLPS